MRLSLYTTTGLQEGFSPACWAVAQWRFREMDMNRAEGVRDGGVGEAVLQERRSCCQGSTEEFCVVRLCLRSLCCPVPGWRGTLIAFATSEIGRRRPPANANDRGSARTAICLLRSDRFAGRARAA